MATELAATTSDRVEKFFEELQTHKSILATCTDLFTTLSNHFSSLQHSLSDKSQSLDSNFQTLHSLSNETLQSLNHRESSIPERESAAAARIEDQKEAAIAELRNPLPATPDLPARLKSISRKMNSSALLRFIVSKRKESVSLRAEIAAAIAEAVDPPRLVLDAVEEFLNSKMMGSKIGVSDKRWACALLIQALSLDSQGFSRRVVERAAGVVASLKEQMDSGAAEVMMFLQMVVVFGLRSRFDEEYLRKLVVEFARRDMAKLAASLEFGDKMIDIIDELVKNGKEIEAVYFASESGLTEKFPPIDLLKSYLRNYKMNVASILMKGNNSQAATDESSTFELNSIKTLIKCVEDHKLESEFNLGKWRKRADRLEITKAEKKSSSSVIKPRKKRAYGSGGGRDNISRGNGSSGGRGNGYRGNGSSSSRPAKSAKLNAYPPSFSRRNLAPPSLQPSPSARFSGPFSYPSQTLLDGSSSNPYAEPSPSARFSGPFSYPSQTSLDGSSSNPYAEPSPSARFSGPFSYPSQTSLDGSSSNPYAATYGISHTQSPAGISQQHYSVSVDNLGPLSYGSSGSYAGQSSYGVYDYGNVAPPSYQSPYTLDQTSYRG